MRLCKYLKAKYYETIVLNIHAIRSAHRFILWEASRIGKCQMDRSFDPIGSMRMYSEMLIKSTIEKETLLRHHKNFINFLHKRYFYMEKVYNQRTFPLSLRDHIFQRDDYCCQICGISKEQAIAKGLHLEIDHKKPWSEGGKTCYDNGRTVCSQCNKGMYHAKMQKIGSHKKRRLTNV